MYIYIYIYRHCVYGDCCPFARRSDGDFSRCPITANVVSKGKGKGRDKGKGKGFSFSFRNRL